MIYLAMALHAEGPTDHAFLEPMIRRAVHDCAHSLLPNAPIEIAPFVELPPHGRAQDAIVAAVERALDGIHLFFLHADGKGQPERARTEQIAPVFAKLRATAPAQRLGCVAIVPVHETEAWPLADLGCVRSAFGTRRSAAELGLPGNPHEVEGEVDPKRRLDGAWRVASSGRRSQRRKRGYRPFLTALGEAIDLARLRRVPAYRHFEQDLTGALQGLISEG